jgi:hypothetical protein
VPLRALSGKKINSQRRTQRYTDKKPIAETVSIEMQIDELVYELYELTEKEVRIVEGNLK